MAGVIPDSFSNIPPGRAIFYASADGIETQVKKRVLKLYEQCKAQRDDFTLEILVETTTNVFLENCIVARRLNLGSLLRYNLLIARLNCDESANAFVKEFFNLHSRDDEALKFINKKTERPRYDYYDEPSYAPVGNMLHAIVMRPQVIDETDAEDAEEEELDPEEIADLNEILQMAIAFADKYKKDVPLDKLRPLADGKYMLTDDVDDYKLVFTKQREFWLKAGTMAYLNLSKLQKAFYLLMLAHPKGIESRRLSEHRDELIHYYYRVFKGGGDDGKVYKDINNLIEIRELDSKFEMPALEQLKSKLNKELTEGILNRTNQLPFIVQNTNGVLHVDLPRKFFVCEDERVKFEIKD